MRTLLTDSRLRANVVPAAICVLILAISGYGIAVAPELVAGVLVVLVLMIVTCVSREVGISLWLVATIAIPFWTVIAVSGIAVRPSYLGIPIAFAVILRRLYDRVKNPYPMRTTAVDYFVTAGVALIVIFQSVYGQQSFLATNAVITLFSGYVIGRFAGVSLQKVYLVAMVIVAIWGIAEFVFSFHVFTGWQADAQGIGPQLQIRGGLARSEASLGHAIAYGACLAAAMPFARYFRSSAVTQLVLAVGVVVSFSRGPILAVVFTFAVMVYVERSTKHRVASFFLLVVGAVAALTLFNLLYNGAGQNDVTLSGGARTAQINQALGYINPIGPATGTQLNSSGRYETNGVDSVDNAPLRLALDFGWIVCVLMLTPALLAAWNTLRRNAGPATVALVCQIPILVVTSFITQWQTLFFFIAGMAVREVIEANRPRRDETTEARL